MKRPQEVDRKDFSSVLGCLNSAQQRYERIGLFDIATERVVQEAEGHLFCGRTERTEVTLF